MRHETFREPVTPEGEILEVPKEQFLKGSVHSRISTSGNKKINNKGFLKVENILVSVYDIILVVSMYFYAFSNILEYIMI